MTRYCIYGDESGNIYNLLKRECSCFVVAVVAGGMHRCRSCPKRQVDRSSDSREFSWRNAPDVEKRRMMQCLSDKDLQFAHIAIRPENVDHLDNSHMLYQEPPQYVTKLVTSQAYLVLLESIQINTNRARFLFDPLFNISDEIAEIVDEETPNKISVASQSSHGEKGIQAADAVAGAVNDKKRKDLDWVDELSTVSETDSFLSRLDSVLQ